MATPTSFVRRGRRFRASAREDVGKNATDPSDDASRDASVDDDGWTTPPLERFVLRRDASPAADARTARENDARTMENDDTERSRSRGRRTVDAVGVGL